MSPRIPITITFIFFFFTFFFFTFFSSTSLSSSLILPHESSNTDIHDLLPQYGLPKGLLPDGVVSYSLSPDGFFRLQLRAPCYVHFVDQLVFYDTDVTGKLGDGSVSEVSGIQAKKLFLWLPVTGIKVRRDSGMLEFFVGAFSEKLPAKQFQDVPKCSPRASLTANLVDRIWPNQWMNVLCL